MKRIHRLFPLLFFFAAAFLLSGCSHSPDAGVLLREAKSNADSIQSCESDFSRELVFTADSAQHTFSSSNKIVYMAKPFGLKSVQKLQTDGTPDTNETYTVTEGGKLFFYCKPNGVWQKTDAGNLDTSPSAQVDLLRVLNEAESQNYVRETTVSSRKVNKIEMKFSNEVLRSAVEQIASTTGMSSHSSTVVQTLLNSAPDLYGYCYIDKETGQLVRIDADFTRAVNQIFQGIDGSQVSVRVTKCTLSGTVGKIGSASPVSLPESAKNASSVAAYG